MNQAMFSMGGEALARSHNESFSNYDAVIIQFNNEWRLIECRDGIQWIIQRANPNKRFNTLWRGSSFHRTSQSLKRVLCNLQIEISPIASQIIDQLPTWIENGRAK